MGGMHTMNSDLVRSLAEHVLTTQGRALAGDADRVEAFCNGLIIARERIGATVMTLTLDYLGERVFVIVGDDDMSGVLRHEPGVWCKALWDAAPGWQAAVKGGGTVKH